MLDLHGNRDDIVEIPFILIDRNGKELSRFHRWVLNNNQKNQGSNRARNPTAVTFAGMVEDFKEWIMLQGFGSWAVHFH